MRTQDIFKNGSGAVDGRSAVMFMICCTNGVGDVKADSAEWTIAYSSSDALDKFCRDNNTQCAIIVQSALLDDYEKLCEYYTTKSLDSV